MNTLDAAFAQSTDAVFGVDVTGRIQFVNNKFERLLGYSRDQLCGTRCAEVLCGTDMHGQSFCGTHCPIPKTVSLHPPVSDFDLMVKRAHDDPVLVNIGACYTAQQQAGQVSVYFSLRRVNSQRLLQRLAVPPAEAQDKKSMTDRSNLTSRETEVLGLATRGMKTKQIAGGLCVSTQTVRTHFKNIYQKIGVHSRTEAVVFALQQGLI